MGCAASPAPQTIALPAELPPSPPPEHVATPIAKLAELDEGQFSSDRGVVRLTAEGAAVSGAYPNGVLVCEAHADVYACEWFESSQQGRATFHRKPDGRLEGTYGANASDDDLGAWTLQPMPRTNMATLDGAWDTNWGLATLHESRTNLHVDYPGGQMDCSHHTPKSLDCAWVEGSLTGTAEFTIEPRVLRGAWTTSAGVKGTWVFVRR